MIAFRPFLNCAATAAGIFFLALPLRAQEIDPLQDLLETLRSENLPNWKMVEEQIWLEWSKSGSPSADLLLSRGREAMENDDLDAAIEHFTALVDHAPDFAEGYNMRATAYFHAGLMGPSLADIQMTLALNPSHFGALSGLGAILESLGDEALALEAYGKAADIHPHNPDFQAAIERLDGKVAGTSL